MHVKNGFCKFLHLCFFSVKAYNRKVHFSRHFCQCLFPCLIINEAMNLKNIINIAVYRSQVWLVHGFPFCIYYVLENLHLTITNLIKTSIFVKQGPNSLGIANANPSCKFLILMS